MKSHLAPIIILVIFLASCTTYQRYDYTASELSFSEFHLTTVMNGHYNEELLTWGAPYSLQLWMDFPADKKIETILVKKISLVGVESGSIIECPDVSSKKPKVYKEKPNILRTVASISVDGYPFSYESYMLKMTIEINYDSEQKPIEKEIELFLKLVPSNERHLDKFDEAMSV